jgi:hypothetical protein
MIGTVDHDPRIQRINYTLHSIQRYECDCRPRTDSLFYCICVLGEWELGTVSTFVEESGRGWMFSSTLSATVRLGAWG